MSRKPNNERKGEIIDLRNQLRDPQWDKNEQKRRDQLKRVIAFMTLGVDTSALFTEMILACVTKDIVQKKMIYMYLTAHSENNAEIAIMSINTLQNDCRDESPLVRGLALRSLASLRLSQLTEYLVPTLKICMTDTSPYVRKTAILATLKLFRIAPDTFREMGLQDKMIGMLRDNDAAVAMNSLAVLQEVTIDEGGIKITRSILFFLLNRLRDTSEWHQSQILQLVHKYTPKDEDEMFDIMNLIEERLRGSNSSVIMACADVFLTLTQNLPNVHKQVFDRLKEPLLTLMSASNCIETSYVILCHIKLLVQRDPSVFQKNHKDFYSRHTDPSYVKCVKINILSTLVNERNWSDIVEELAAHVGETNPEVSRLSIAGMCKVALKIESSASKVLENYLEFMALDVEHIRGRTLSCMKDFLRKYTDVKRAKPFLEAIVRSFKDMAFEDDESRLALVWVLGEFGDHIDDAPYLIEGMSEDFNVISPSLRTEILTSSVKLLFKRPPEMQPILGRIFNLAINDFSHADVHDRALLYYRLLRLNSKACHEVVCSKKETVRTFVEDNNSDLRDKLFEEFNTLSVIYNIPSTVFMKSIYEDEVDEDEEEDEGDEEEDDAKTDENEDGLLKQPKARAPKAELILHQDPSVEPPAFQKKWGKLTTSETLNLRFSKIPSTEDLEKILEEYNIFVMAQGQQGGTTKIYLYSQPAENEELHFLVELLIQATAAGQATIKSDDKRLKEYVAVFKKAISSFCKI